MSGIEQAANDLFFKLRNRFPRINMGDQDGNTTSNPMDGRFFNFDYEEDEVKFGNITASLIDNQNLKVYFSKDITEYMDRLEKQNWYKFLQEIRKFAKGHMMGLEIRDISKDVLSHKDLQFVSNQNKEKSQIGESRVLWARRGTISEGEVGNVKVHVIHSERMDENPNNRLLRVDRIFLVNESGERFLMPFKSVMAAKAMANHVGRGGNPYDNNGRLISNAVNEMANLRRFASATRRKTFESEDAGQVIVAAHAIKESIKRSLFRLANNSRFDENLEDLGKILAEQDDVDDIKPMFVQQVYNENLDNWINSAARAYKQYKGNIMENLKESAGTVAQKLSDPSWRLVLKDDPSEDRLIASSKYADGRALLRRVLGTIADRIGMDDSDIANWSSQIGQDIEDGKASREDMQIALQLAKRYQDDLRQIASNAEYGKEVRTSSFGTRRTLAPRAKSESSEFENYVDSIGEEEHEMEEDGPVIVQDPRNPLPPLSAIERLQQKLGVGAFKPQTPSNEPVNTDPLPGSPGASQADRDALTRMIDQPDESVEDPSDDLEDTDPEFTKDPPESAMDRISERVASRATNEALDTMLWLSGVKKKSELEEANPVMPQAASLDDFMPKSSPPEVKPSARSFTGSSSAPDVSVNKPRYSFSSNLGKFTQLPDKGFQTAPKLDPQLKGGPVGPLQQAPELKVPYDQIRGMQGPSAPSTSPEIKVSPDDKIKAGSTGSMIGQAIKSIAPKLALPLALVTPSDQLAGPADSEMSSDKAKDLRLRQAISMPTSDQPTDLAGNPKSALDVSPSTVFDPTPIDQQKRESIDLLKALAGIGK